MVVTGLALLAVYVTVAYILVAAGLLAVGSLGRTDPLVTVAVALVTALGVGYLSYRVGAARLLASMDAIELKPRDAPGLHRRLDRLCDRMDLPRPRLLVARMTGPNALSIGGHGGTVVFDDRLLGLLDGDELEAILAHELAHIAGRDGLVQTVGATTIQMVSGMLFAVLLPVGVVLAGVARGLAWLSGRRPEPFGDHLARTHVRVATAVVVVMFAFTLALRAHSRRRELAADDRAAAVTDPHALARALYRIQQASRPPRGPLSSLYIHGREEGLLSRLLATHPPMDERIERLLDRAERDRRKPRRIPVR